MSAATKKYERRQTGALLLALLLFASVSLIGCRSFYERSLPPPPPVAGMPANVDFPTVDGISPVVEGPPTAMIDPQAAPYVTTPPARPGLLERYGLLDGWQNGAKLTLSPQTIVGLGATQVFRPPT